eukprot:SAG31_NODE_1386_length_8574_cov_2.055037_10_plen_64_part_00
MSDEHEVTLTSPGGTRRQWDPDSPGVRESESADSELAQELARLRLEVFVVDVFDFSYRYSQAV